MPRPSFQMEINYPPKFKSRYGHGLPKAKHIQSLFKNMEDAQLDFLTIISKYKKQLSLICIEAEENDPVARWNQPWFTPLDGMSMYTMVAANNPKKYIEIGSGNSTKFAVQAIKDNSLHDTKVISVDPQPRTEIDKICDRVIRKPLEEASELEEIFATLEPNDIVFFDGSHRCLQNSDVTAFFIDYLPTIPEGVKIGIHDIYWPNDYPERWINRYYNEQYILGAYMLGMGRKFPLIFSCMYMSIYYAKEISNCLNPDLVSQFKELGMGIGGGSLWFSKHMI